MTKGRGPATKDQRGWGPLYGWRSPLHALCATVDTFPGAWFLLDRPAPALVAHVRLDDERAVVLRLQSGDTSAAAVLYGWFRDPVWRAILARLPDVALAEDVLRDTFRTVLEKIGSYTPTDVSVGFWIRRIAVNKAMDAHRLRARDQALQERLQADTESARPASPPRPDRALEAEDTARDVQTSLSRMNDRYAEALRLRMLDDLPRETCAERLGITLGTFDVLLHRAAKAFRKVYPP